MSVFTQETTWNVEYYDIDDLINEHYPHAKGKFEILAHEELGNDIVFDVDIDADEELDDYDRGELNKGKLMFNTGLILNVLARQGFLPFTKGKLYINVSY